MTINADRPVEDRLLELLEHFGLGEVHVAARRLEDWKGFVGRYSDRVTSLTLVCPHAIEMAPLSSIASRVVALTGDQGPMVGRLRQSLAALSEAVLVTLPDYAPQAWSD